MSQLANSSSVIDSAHGQADGSQRLRSVANNKLRTDESVEEAAIRMFRDCDPTQFWNLLDEQEQETLGTAYLDAIRDQGPQAALLRYARLGQIEGAS